MTQTILDTENVTAEVLHNYNEELEQQYNELQQEQAERWAELKQKLTPELLDEVEQLLFCDQELKEVIEKLNSEVEQ